MTAARWIEQPIWQMSPCDMRHDATVITHHKKQKQQDRSLSRKTPLCEINDVQRRLDSDQIQREEPKICLKLKAVVADVLLDQQQNSVIVQKQKGRAKAAAIPVATMKGDGERDKTYIADSGHQKAHAQGVQFVHSGTMVKIKARRKEMSDSRLQVRQKKGQQATRQAKALQEKQVYFRSAFFLIKKDDADQV